MLRGFIVGLLLMLGSACSSPTSITPPNIVLIIGDDHGYPYFGFTGSAHVHTPYMDRLAHGGALFTHGHTTDNHCRPALQTLSTGLYPIQYAAQLEAFKAREQSGDPEYSQLAPEEQAQWDFLYEANAMREFETLPGLLSRVGYVSFQAGKWWEQSFANGGFTEGMSKGWDPDEVGQPGFFGKLMGGDGVELVRETSRPVFDFIDRNLDTPFFLWYGPSLPHVPLNPPEAYYARYRDTNLSESAKEYYGNCTWFDAGVGDLLNHLEMRGLLFNTLIVYVNDNGWEQPPFEEYKDVPILYNNGGPNGKLSLHDQAFRTPIIFNWPGTINDAVFDDLLVSSADLVPTLLDYAGIKIPEFLPGASLRPVIEGRGSIQRDALIGRVMQMRSETDPMGKRQTGYYVRTLQWHFTFTEGEVQLFNVEENPFEDVSADHPELISGFLEQIEAWREEFNSPVLDPSLQ